MNTKFFVRLLLFLLTVGTPLSPTAVAADTARGFVAGRALHADTGLPVVGATVSIPGGPAETKTDLDGRFRISGVAAGAVNVVVAREGFQSATVTGVVVGTESAADVSVALHPMGGEVVKMDSFSVTAEVAAGSDMGLLSSRQKSAAVSDAIGGMQFGRLAIGNAAEAMAKVTGASLVDGKYVMIRGLGDRYSNTLLNGVAVPTADPDKRAVQMDQFPADLLESIVTTKSFTPDQPGSFSGGSVNLKTKSFPQQFFFSLSSSVEYRQGVTGHDFLTTPGTSRDRFALGASDRGAPVLAGAIPDRTAANIAARQGNLAPATQLDTASKAFDNRGYFPRVTSAAPSMGLAIAFGDQIPLSNDRLFGYTASVTFDRDEQGYTGGEKNRFEGIVSAPQVKLALTPETKGFSFPAATRPAGMPALGVTNSQQSVAWGAFAKLAVRLAANHEVSLDLFHNQSADDVVQRGVGEQQRDYPGNFYEVYDLQYTQRGVSSVQLAGKSLFPSAQDLRVDYRVSYSKSSLDQPDYRTLAAYYDPSGAAVNATGVQPNRFFRELSEDSREAAVDVSRVVTVGSRELRLKAGLNRLQGDRDYSEERFQWSNRPQSRADLEAFPGPVGIIGQTPGSVTFGNTVARLQEPNNYAARQTITAGYFMGDLLLTSRLRAIAGVRFERTDMSTRPVPVPGLNPRNGSIEGTDALPALNLVYEFGPHSNIRVAYGRTLARPTFKELTDVRSEDVFTLDTYLGNPALDRTLIDNLDLRWEWFPRRGETVAVSAFAKRMSNPIEVVFTPASGATQPQNVDRGEVYGLEFEFRRGLSAYFRALESFSFGANLALVASRVTIPEVEMSSIRLQEPNAKSRRELLGQSPYVFNTDLTYSHRSSGTTATLSYNVVGKRLALVQFGSLPDVYEMPAGRLNLVLSQRLSARFRLKFTARNLLDPAREKLVPFEKYDLVYDRYRTGRSYSLGVTWLFE
jgi:hypothetical protein